MPILPKRRLAAIPAAQLSLADEAEQFERNALPDEVQRYLRAVDEYRTAGYPPNWRPESCETITTGGTINADD